jgi:hypothetical protein
MLVSKMLSDEAREYLTLRREEELIKIWVKVAERRATLAREEAAAKKAEATAAREAVAREQEIDVTVSHRNPPAVPLDGKRRLRGPNRCALHARHPRQWLPMAPPRPSCPTSLVPHVVVGEQPYEDVGNGDSQPFHDNYVHPTQESVVSKTQPDYLSTPATACLLSSINSRHPLLTTPGVFHFLCEYLHAIPFLEMPTSMETLANFKRN